MPDLPDYLAKAMTDPQLAGAAARIVRNDATLRSQVEEVFRRSLREHWGYGAKARAAEYLARQGHPIGEILDGLLSKPTAYRTAMRLALQCTNRLPESSRGQASVLRPGRHAFWPPRYSPA